MRASSVLVISVIAISACNQRKPDEEWRPQTVPADARSVETLPAGTQPPQSLETAIAGGSDASAKPSAAPVGTVSAIELRPVILRNTLPVEAAVGMPILAGDRITTGEKTKIRMTLLDGSVLAVGPRSAVTMARYETAGNRRLGTLRVGIGSFWFQVTKWAQPENSAIDIETPNAVAGVRGTTLWGDTQRQVVCALEGVVSVTSLSNKDLKPASLEAGHCVGELAAAKLTPITPDAATVQTYLDEVQIK